MKALSIALIWVSFWLNPFSLYGFSEELDPPTHEEISHYAQGGDLVEQFIRFLFPISGREKRTMFLPMPYWGKNKPQYLKFDWKRFESDHFNFYAYPAGEQTLPLVMKWIEEDHERNNRIFGVENRFTKKIPVIFYQTRRDFEQTTILEGVVPEGLGGVTELFSWKRVTFPYEGEQALLAHVAKHEATHIYQIAKGAKRLPLWFIEGSAETLSNKWDSRAEMVIRDAYLNGFFFHLEDMWQIEGTWLMYKQGGFITNLIWDEYGEKGFRRIFENASSKYFEDNLKDSLDLTIEQLDQKVFAALAAKYGGLLARKDLTDRAIKVKEGQVLLHTREPFFLTGGGSGPRNAIYVNHLSPDGTIVKKVVVSDKRFGNESLDSFRKGAWMDDKNIVYAVKSSRQDVVRIVPYQFDPTEREFVLGEPMEFSWPQLASVADPILVDENKLAFIGLSAGDTNLYTFDLQSQELKAITTTNEHLSHLDYSPVRRELVFSREDGPTQERAQFDRDIYTFHLDTGVLTAITRTPDQQEIAPVFSSDGKSLLYVSNPDITFDLMMYDFEDHTSRRLTKMRIGASSPHWWANGDILFMSSAKMSPTIYRALLPNLRETLDVALPGGEVQTLELRGSQFSVPVEPDASKAVPPKTEEGFQFRDGKLIVGRQGNPFSAQQFATLGQEVIVKSQRGLPESKRVDLDDRSHYFSYDGAALTPLAQAALAMEGISTSLQREISSKAQGRAVIQGWIGSEGKQALVLLNNRLAREEETFKKSPDVSLARFDLATGELEEFPEGPIEEVTDAIQWVSFLNDSKTLLALGEKPSGPFELHLYDRLTKAFKEIDFDVDQFRVSPDGTHVAWLKENSLFFRGVEDKDDERVGGIPSWSSGTLSFDFLSDNRLILFGQRGDRFELHVVGPHGKTEPVTFVDHEKGERVLQSSVDSMSGDVAIRVKPKVKGAGERLRIYRFGTKALQEIELGAMRYRKLVFRKGNLIFEAQPQSAEGPTEWIWRNGKLARFDQVVRTEKLEDGSMIFRGNKTLTLFDPKTKSSDEIAGTTAGYALNEKTIIYSALEGNHFRLRAYDRKTGVYYPLSSGDQDSIDPVIQEGFLIWSEFEDASWKLKKAKLDSIQRESELKIQGHELARPQKVGDATTVDVFSPPPARIKESALPEFEYEPRLLVGHPASKALRLQSLAAAAAYDGDSFRYFISGFADNLFSDKGVFVNSIFLADAKYATVGYSDLTSGYTYSFFYNQQDEVENFGIEASRSFLLDRYREITFYSDLETQRYGLAVPSTARFVTPDVENRNFYLLRLGSVFSYDVTVWDRHGPVSGSRFFLKAESGLDAGNQQLANVDAALDFRLYHEILPRFGFAHRLVAGTSQGDLPSVYLLGGNMSFRGVGFDDLEGQNYWVFSEDMRVPVFDFVGAKLFDPLDRAMGFLLRYFDVRGGIYGDIGSAWYNGDHPNVTYSVGYFVNVPTIFGFAFRWNQGFIGEKRIGFWFGFNW